MRFRIASILLTVPLFIGLGAFPQESFSPSSGHFATSRELLKDRHIELTTPALIAALQNPDSHVRYLAALMLAEDKATTATPAISDALAAEKDPETRVNIAFALAQLGDDRGFAALESACNDANTPALIRMYSTKYLLDLNHESCLNSAIAVAESKEDSGARVTGLSLLPRFHHLSSSNSQRVRDTILNALLDRGLRVRVAAIDALGLLRDASALPHLEQALSDRDPAARIAASNAIRTLGDASALRFLQNAIATERDETVLSRLRADLKELQGRN